MILCCTRRSPMCHSNKMTIYNNSYWPLRVPNVANLVTPTTLYPKNIYEGEGGTFGMCAGWGLLGVYSSKLHYIWLSNVQVSIGWFLMRWHLVQQWCTVQLQLWMWKDMITQCEPLFCSTLGHQGLDPEACVLFFQGRSVHRLHKGLTIDDGLMMVSVGNDPKVVLFHSSV